MPPIDDSKGLWHAGFPVLRLVFYLLLRAPIILLRGRACVSRPSSAVAFGSLACRRWHCSGSRIGQPATHRVARNRAFARKKCDLGASFFGCAAWERVRGAGRHAFYAADFRELGKCSFLRLRPRRCRAYTKVSPRKTVIFCTQVGFFLARTRFERFKRNKAALRPSRSSADSFVPQ